MMFNAQGKRRRSTEGAQGTNTGHENGEAMASVGVRLTAQLGADCLDEALGFAVSWFSMALLVCGDSHSCLRQRVAFPHVNFATFCKVVLREVDCKVPRMVLQAFRGCDLFVSDP